MKYSTSLDINPKDLDALFKSIGWRSRGKKWKEVLSKSSFLITAWDGKKLVGMGRIMEDGVMCMFYDIAVDKKYQRQGIGSEILKRMISKVKDKKYASIGLFAWERNPGNKKFYSKHGFVEKTSGMELEMYMRRE